MRPFLVGRLIGPFMEASRFSPTHWTDHLVQTQRVYWAEARS